MKINVLFFAMIREKFKKDQDEFEFFEGEDVETFTRRILGPHFETDQFLKSLGIAVNQEYVSKNYLLREGDEVAWIPPVAGG